ncbi:hypothetical protein R2601_03283 [Salipiger bermudensis HTCC2601]|uniref:Uncharacterized protein n=1 Tax=Salipiger bermudensis (strain DSM 26914 / JCM 13377 / KCTC 12554 / HTCC2601) TaxID=314265 RepID=Q0FWI9_SALBH|nr:hypothetical protein R2601_03283 [Salipiger bermudensis HTCC2601]
MWRGPFPLGRRICHINIDDTLSAAAKRSRLSV